MKFIILALIVSGLSLFAYVAIWLAQLYKDAGLLVIIGLGDPIHVLGPVTCGAILIGVGLGIRDREKSKSSSLNTSTISRRIK